MNLGDYVEDLANGYFDAWDNILREPLGQFTIAFIAFIFILAGILELKKWRNQNETR